MGLPQKSLAYITPEEYLALEAVAKEKHEYLDGRIYAWQGDGPNGMVGAPLAHNRVSINVLVALLAQKPGTDCEVMMSDVRVAPKGDRTYFYPDVMVRCGRRLPGHVMEVDDACLIVEVLSDSTEAFDRGEKFADYRSMATLETYLLVHPGRRTIEAFERASGWIRRVIEPADSLEVCGGRMKLSHSGVFAGF